MSDDRAEVLREILDRTYSAADHAALIWQTESWSVGRPLSGVRIADATPVFHNTLAKYVPMLAAGADLTVCLSPLLPHDPVTADLLRQIGVAVIEGPDSAADQDVVLDCAGVLAMTPCRAGYVELTKSGERIYASSAHPVFMADASRIKLIETILGTGDGFVRGLAHFGHVDLSDRSIVVFGGGKVGRGAAWQARRAGARVTVIDLDPDVFPALRGDTVIDAADQEAVLSSLDDAWCIVTATGIPGALAKFATTLGTSNAILANLGAEDEFGAMMPAERVLNGKAPVNFALAEPTRLRYLDATFALHNACGRELLTGRHESGISAPPPAVESQILAVARHSSAIADELAAIEEGLI